MTSALNNLSDAGVSVWLDTLSRERIASGGLAELVERRHVVGVTTNPTIFNHAIGRGTEYASQISELAARGAAAEEAVRTITATDVRDAADVLRPVFVSSPNGQDGRISVERATDAGVDLSWISSVASFFVSRVDTEVDRGLDALTAPEAKALRGKAAVANARLAYEAFEGTFSGDRWERLRRAGANKQRPLWASTGVKDAAYEADKYVVGLIAQETVNTMPEKTVLAVDARGLDAGDSVRGTYTQARADLDAVERLGVPYAEVVQQLEEEGVDKVRPGARGRCTR